MQKILTRRARGAGGAPRRAAGWRMDR
eukprot:COSAG02_NODE_18844_length_914_cov_4.255215_1_plen_26_part_10